MSHLRGVLFLVLIGAVIPGLAWAGGPRDHENGFFLRMVLGGGTAKSELSEGENSLEFSGPAGVFDIAIGGTVTSNLAIHGSLFGWLISDPDVELSVGAGDSLYGGTGTASGDLSLSAFGGGVTYYFMPINLYLSGNVGVGALSGSGEIDGETDAGLALNFMVGKEWWVSNRWGLGLAGAFGYHSFPEKDSNEDWTGTNFTLLFSATFN
jgi:hypothetical protein